MVDSTEPFLDEAVSTASLKGQYGYRVVTDREAMARVWAEMNSSGEPVCGFAQTIEWLNNWQDCVNSDCFITVIYFENSPALLLPIEIVKSCGVVIARYPGGTHANSNFPVITRDVQFKPSADVIDRLLSTIRTARPDIDVLHLGRQLERLQGIENPLLRWNRCVHPNIELSATLSDNFLDYLDRGNARRKLKKHRQHQRQYESAAGYRVHTASTVAESDALLNRFFLLKAARLRNAGIADVFADPAVRRFFKALAASSLQSDSDMLQIKALEVDGTPRAIIGTSHWMGVMTSQFSAIGDSWGSPGEFLYFEDIAASCEKAIPVYSFGVGDEPYKRRWCSTETTLYDTYLGLTVKGRALAAALRLRNAIVRPLKKNTAIWGSIQRVRRLSKPRIRH